MDYTTKLQKALDFIEVHLYDDHALKEMNGYIGLSKWHFSNIFKKNIGMGVYKYIQKRRISKASLLLTKTDMKIIDIAFLSCFSSQEAFSRVFKHYYQLPPYQYRMHFKNFLRGDNTMSNEIKHWIVSGVNYDKYSITLDSQHFHSGKNSVLISCDEKTSSEEYATVMQQISAENYLSKRIKLSAYAKSENIEGFGGIWLRIDDQQFRQLKLDNMSNRGISGTTEWNYYSCVLDVSAEAGIINFGSLLQGQGKLWVDDFCLETVSKDVKTTDFNLDVSLDKEPKNLSFDE